MLSPRRIKASPSVVLYELRMIRPSTRCDKLLRLFEGNVKKWRGQARWYVQAHTSARGETVLQVVGERQSLVARVDNLYASWRRAVGRALQLSNDGNGIKRATWTAVGAENYSIDIHVMHDVFDAAVAKLWAEIASAADAVRCSYLEPAMPSQLVKAELPPPSRAPPTSAQLKAAPTLAPLPTSKTLTLSGSIIQRT